MRILQSRNAGESLLSLPGLYILAVGPASGCSRCFLAFACKEEHGITTSCELPDLSQLVSQGSAACAAADASLACTQVIRTSPFDETLAMVD